MVSPIATKDMVQKLSHEQLPEEDDHVQSLDEVTPRSPGSGLERFLKDVVKQILESPLVGLLRGIEQCFRLEIHTAHQPIYRLNSFKKKKGKGCC
jgi:hypothetical protein